MLDIEAVLRVMAEGRQEEIGFVHPALPPEGEDDVSSAADAMVLDLAGRMDDAIGEQVFGYANHDVVRRLVRSWGTWPTFWHLTARWALDAAHSPDAERIHAMLDSVANAPGGEGAPPVPRDAVTLARVMLASGAVCLRRLKENHGELSPAEVVGSWATGALMAHSLIAEDDDLHREEGAPWWVLELLVGAALGGRYLAIAAEEDGKERRKPARTRPKGRRNGRRKR